MNSANDLTCPPHILTFKNNRGSGALSARQLAGRDYENSPVCGVCWEGGELLCCDFCPGTFIFFTALTFCTNPAHVLTCPLMYYTLKPGSFHMECIGLGPDDFGSGAWSCPHHACAACNMKATAAGGLLFRCEMCSNAFCEGALCCFLLSLVCFFN